MHRIFLIQPLCGTARGSKLFFALLTLVLSLSGIAGCADPVAPDTRLEVQYRSLPAGGFTRSYLFIRPDSSNDQPLPLLLLYHGSGGNAGDLIAHTTLASTALTAGMVVASLEAVPGYGGRWATNPVDLDIVDDVAFTRAVLEALAEELSLDRTRVFAAGYSRGGEFVYQLACRAPELVRGVAAVSATLLRSNLGWCEATLPGPQPVSVTMVLGSEDEVIPWEGGPKRLGAVETMAHWRERNGCPSTAAETDYPARTNWEVTLNIFAPCSYGDVRLFRAVGLGHGWPGMAFDVEHAIISEFTAVPAG